MLAKGARSNLQPKAEADDVCASVDRLAEEVRILRQVLDEIQDDFAWATRNGLASKVTAPMVVKKMALDPLAADWNQHIEIEGGNSTNESMSPNNDHLEKLVCRIEDTVENVAEGQLEVVLTFLGGMRRQFLEALAKSAPVVETAEPNPSASSDSARESVTDCHETGADCVSDLKSNRFEPTLREIGARLAAAEKQTAPEPSNASRHFFVIEEPKRGTKPKRLMSRISEGETVWTKVPKEAKLFDSQKEAAAFLQERRTAMPKATVGILLSHVL